MSWPCPIPSHASRVCWCALALITTPACTPTEAQRAKVAETVLRGAPAACLVYQKDLRIPREPELTATCDSITHKCAEPAK